MAQAGIPVPADRAEFPIFDAILADIGDYQSIEQNLSTFSAHVTNIDFISRTATRESLVLLDELGSATDPEEGAALAVAIADHFRRIGCITIISTHHTSLKVYGVNTSGVVNAAVGFDEATLQPTYELRVGVPGASAGINIAQRLGLNPQIIESARGRLTTQTQDIARFLDRLHAELREAEAERLRLRTRKQNSKKKERVSLPKARTNSKPRSVRWKRNSKASSRTSSTTRGRPSMPIQDRAAAQKLSKDAERRIAKMRREFREQFDSAVVAHCHRSGSAGIRTRSLKSGEACSRRRHGKAQVRGPPGTVTRRIDDNHFEVEIGAMKMKIARDDIAEVISRSADSPVKAARARGISVSLRE